MKKIVLGGMVNFYTFYLSFFIILLLEVRIRIWNTDPVPQSCWIRIQFGSVKNKLNYHTNNKMLVKMCFNCSYEPYDVVLE